MTTRIPCKKCNAMVLPTTAEEYDGLCKPCFDSTVSDDAKSYRRINPYIIPGETLVAVFGSDRRLIFYDQVVLLKKKCMVSIPYHQSFLSFWRNHSVGYPEQNNVFLDCFHLLNSFSR